jgi:magnesium transporter
MLFAYRPVEGKLVEADPASALWIDVLRPDPAEAAVLASFVPEIPTAADMAEIEISARLYREDATDVMTVMVPGIDRTDKLTPVIGPAAFLLSVERLVTVRYHATRPFETYPQHAQKTALGCGSPERVFLGLAEEIIGRIADLLEGAGAALDEVMRKVLAGGTAGPDAALLQVALETAGRQSEMVGNCRLSLLSLERALGFFEVSMTERGASKSLHGAVKGLTRDIQSLEVHVDYLSNRVSQTFDATLGMINLAQNTTVRIVSVVAVLFLPPTLIASVYGMNFHAMPELDWRLGYPLALVLMVASALGCWAFFKWKKWL